MNWKIPVLAVFIIVYLYDLMLNIIRVRTPYKNAKIVVRDGDTVLRGKQPDSGKRVRRV